MERYDHALAAALVILEQMDARPGMARHQMLSLIVFSILHAINSMDEQRAPLEPSLN